MYVLQTWIGAGIVSFVLILMVLNSPSEGQLLALYFFGLSIGILIYGLPAIVARHRHHRQFLAILALNILLGWSFLGWVVAMVWACTDNTQSHATRSEDM